MAAEPPVFAKALQRSFRRAFDHAAELRHEYVTLEHVLHALLDDAKVKEALKACGADLRRLRERLDAFLRESVEQLPGTEPVEPQQTLGVSRVVKWSLWRSTL